MIVRTDFEQNTPEWREERRGKVMGSIAADVIPKKPTKLEITKALDSLAIPYEKTALVEQLLVLLPLEALIELRSKQPKKMGFYQLIADWLAIPPMEEDGSAMQRGHDLEEEAVDMLSTQIGRKVHRVGMCQRDDEPRIANSPDGIIRGRGKWTGAVEVKCLKSAMHIKACIDNKIPSTEPYDYWSQAMQYFVVNDDLKVLYFVFYDPRVKSRPFHVIEIHRKDVEETVQKLLGYQKDALAEADMIAERLAF